MKIHYENCLEDMVAFNRYHFTNSPTVRWRWGVLRWGVPLLFVGVPILPILSLWENADDVADGTALVSTVAILFPLVIICPLWILLTPLLFRISLDRQVRQLYSEGKNKGSIGPHEMELTESSIIERNTFSEHTTRLAGIERIVNTGQQTLIYISALSAHVIPHNAVWEGNLEEFTQALIRRVANLQKVPEESIMRRMDHHVR